MYSWDVVFTKHGGSEVRVNWTFKLKICGAANKALITTVTECMFASHD